jgi:NAD+ diphosphatase
MPLSIITNTFAGNPLDRASERRGDGLDRRKARRRRIASRSRSGTASPGRGRAGRGRSGPASRSPICAPTWPRTWPAGPKLLFLGLWKDIAVFAVDLDGNADPAEGPLKGLGRFEELRGVAASLPPPTPASWPPPARCSNGAAAIAGAPTAASLPRSADAGWKRICPACKAEHFPRTDPVAIMLPGAWRALPAGPPGGLAGRHVLGPGGLPRARRDHRGGLRARTDGRGRPDGDRVRYHSSQPWPWPSSLMIGLIAQVDSDATSRPDRAGRGALVLQGRGGRADQGRTGGRLRAAGAGHRPSADQGVGGGIAPPPSFY